MPGIKLPQINTLSPQKEVSASEKTAVKSRSEPLQKVLAEFPVIPDDAKIFYLNEQWAAVVDAHCVEQKKRYDWVVNSKKNLNSIKQIYGSLFNGDLNMVDNLRSIKQDLRFPVNVVFGEASPGDVVMALNILAMGGSAVFRKLPCLPYYLYILAHHFAEVHITSMHIVCLKKMRAFDNKFMFRQLDHQSIDHYVQYTVVPDDFKKVLNEHY